MSPAPQQKLPVAARGCLRPAAVVDEGHVNADDDGLGAPPVLVRIRSPCGSHHCEGDYMLMRQSEDARIFKIMQYSLIRRSLDPDSAITDAAVQPGDFVQVDCDAGHGEQHRDAALHLANDRGWISSYARDGGLVAHEVPGGFLVANGQPVWKLLSGDRWLYSNLDQKWTVGGPGEAHVKFDSTIGYMFNTEPHKGVLPQLQGGQWKRWTGKAWNKDPNIAITAHVPTVGQLQAQARFNNMDEDDAEDLDGNPDDTPTRIQFRSGVSMYDDFTPYSTVYGQHPQEFDFDDRGQMILRDGCGNRTPKPRLGFGFTSAELLDATPHPSSGGAKILCLTVLPEEQ